MNILIFCSNDIFAGIVGHKLISEKGNLIKCIFLEKGRMNGKSSIEIFKKMIRKSGVRYPLYQAAELLSYEIISKIRRGIKCKNSNYMPLELPSYLANRYGINTDYIDFDISDEAFLDKIKSYAPDLIICLRFSRILEKPLLSIPKYDVLNFHGSLLPKYGGLGSIFQAVYHKEEITGGSMHFMSETIDEGHILGQSHVPIRPSDSVSRVHFKVYLTSAALLLKAVDMIMNQRICNISKNTMESSYYSWPKKEDIIKFKQSGGRFISLSDLLYFYRIENHVGKI
ncbi:Methionyl-tRNA formyltransferase [subsurface metagenome]